MLSGASRYNNWLSYHNLVLILPMLPAAVCGNIFASPGPIQVRRGIELTDNEKGSGLHALTSYLRTDRRFSSQDSHHCQVGPSNIAILL